MTVKLLLWIDTARMEEFAPDDLSARDWVAQMRGEALGNTSGQPAWAGPANVGKILTPRATNEDDTTDRLAAKAWRSHLRGVERGHTIDRTRYNALVDAWEALTDLTGDETTIENAAARAHALGLH